MATGSFRIAIVLAAIVTLTPALVLAQVPTAQDMAACNKLAKEEMQTASASPRLDAETKPVSAAPKRDAAGGILDAAPGPAPKQPPADTGKPLAKTEADPQLQGIDPEGEKDPAYVAAYKKCMRQSGF